jgi:hypothetical protein
MNTAQQPAPGTIEWRRQLRDEAVADMATTCADDFAAELGVERDAEGRFSEEAAAAILRAADKLVPPIEDDDGNVIG